MLGIGMFYRSRKAWGTPTYPWEPKRIDFFRLVPFLRQLVFLENEYVVGIQYLFHIVPPWGLYQPCPGRSKHPVRSFWWSRCLLFQTWGYDGFQKIFKKILSEAPQGFSNFSTRENDSGLPRAHFLAYFWKIKYSRFSTKVLARDSNRTPR